MLDVAGTFVLALFVVLLVRAGAAPAAERAWSSCVALYEEATTRADSLRIDARRLGGSAAPKCAEMRIAGGPQAPPFSTTNLGVLGAVLVLFVGAYGAARVALRRVPTGAADSVRAVGGPFPTEWRATIERTVPIFSVLGESERSRVLTTTSGLLTHVDFEGCGGLDVDFDMRLSILAQAAVLTLGSEGRAFARLKRVLVYPSSYEVPHTPLQSATWRTGQVTSEEPRASSGESWVDGIVVLAWDRVEHDLATPHSGHDLIWHEFAHQLDQADGSADGLPHVLGREVVPGWKRRLDEELGRLRQGESVPSNPLRDYAATNEAEFFAVCTEVFFDTPHRLRAAYPDLYVQLQALYRIDPSSWWTSDVEGAAG